MQAKGKLPYPINAFTGRELVGYEWRQVPAGCEAEAERLAEAGLVELRQHGVEVEPLQLAEPEVDTAVIEQDDPPTLSADLDSLTVEELKEMARERGVVIGRKNKAELIDALRDD